MSQNTQHETRSTGLILLTCAALATALVAVLLVWLISGDLEGTTVIGGLVFVALLGGIAALARKGRVKLAAWLLVALMGLLVLADSAAFGLGSPSIIAYLIPMVAALCALGFAAGIAVTLVGCAVIWLIAIAGWFQWYQPWAGFAESHLTYNAPVLTVIFLLVAVMIGWWNRARGDAGTR